MLQRVVKTEENSSSNARLSSGKNSSSSGNKSLKYSSNPSRLTEKTKCILQWVVMTEESSPSKRIIVLQGKKQC